MAQHSDGSAEKGAGRAKIFASPPSDPWAIPSPWIRRFAHLVPQGGTVLDLAAGGGRHARFFAARGCRATAVDRDLGGIADPAAMASLERIEADLETGVWPLGGRRFDAVVVANYLHRPLLPILPEVLMPGGVLLYETFALGQEAFGRPRSPDFLLKPNELLDVFARRLTVIGYEYGIDHTAAPKAVQRIAARKETEPAPL